MGLSACTSLCLSSPVKAQPPNGGESTRIIEFPKSHSLGRILIGNDRLVFGDSSLYQPVAAATGTVKLKVAPDKRVVFEANHRVFENPDCLNKISEVGIDTLKLNLISLDDREDEMCDRALGYVKHFQSLTELDTDRSDASDVGVAKLKDVHSLQCLSCFLSAITGSCFKDLATLPNLKGLWVPDCNIHTENLKYLPQFPKLQDLNLDRTHLNEKGCSYLVACTHLQKLSVRGNKEFNNNCLKSLAKLPKLKTLDLRVTAVTFDGFKNLSWPALTLLVVPECMAKDVGRLKKLLPHTAIAAGVGVTDLSTDDKALYAPLH